MDQDELIVGSEVLKSETSKERMRGSGLWLAEDCGWKRFLLKMSGQPSRVVCYK